MLGIPSSFPAYSDFRNLIPDLKSVALERDQQDLDNLAEIIKTIKKDIDQIFRVYKS
jgi:hypothetical protein